MMKFHEYHGDNIELQSNGTVAFRRTSFAHGITFSERPLLPNELFLIQIDRNENGWSGHMRLGLTQVNPEARPPLPPYALPDLNQGGQAWVCAISKMNPFSLDGPHPVLHNNATEHRRNVLANIGNSDDGSSPTSPALPTDVGSQVGVFYKVTGAHHAAMHIVINGEDQGPSAVDIPLRKPLYAIVDVYGTTKQIRISPLAPKVQSLQQLCRTCIVKTVICPQRVEALPLPKYLLAFLTEGHCRPRKSDRRDFLPTLCKYDCRSGETF